MKRLAVFLMLAASCHWPAAAAEREKVDVALVLLVDASGSMSSAELSMARRSHARAVVSAEVLGAIAEGEQGRIALAYVEYAEAPAVRVGWSLIDGAISATAFAALVAEGRESSPGSLTGLGSALVAADGVFDALPYDASRLVVDVVGDGRNNVVPHPIVGQRLLLARGAVVNAMPLMLSPDDAGIDEYFAAEIAAGPGHFVIPVREPERFAATLRSKLVLELY